jgi:hypothetical protein
MYIFFGILSFTEDLKRQMLTKRFPVTFRISEKQQLLTVPDLGENMAAVQGLLKKHDAFETDLSVHTDRCNEICSAGQKLIDDGNHHADSIVNRCDQVTF